MKLGTFVYGAAIAAVMGLGIGMSSNANADYSCIRGCRLQYNDCLANCSTANCRASCFYYYENCIDGCST